MSFVCSSLSCSILGVAIALCVGIIIYFKWSYSYWKRKGLPSLKTTSWYGNMENPFNSTKMLGIRLKENYDEFKKKGCSHGGIYNFTAPAYFPIDPDFVKNIMQIDFPYFGGRGLYYNEKADPLSANLVSLEGDERWRNLRMKLTPTFTSGKLKMMFETLVECSFPLKSMLDELTAKKQKVDISEVVALYTTDVIGSCAFGLDCDSFKRPNTEFRQFGKQILEMSSFQLLLSLFCISKPSIGYLFNIRVFPKSATDFFFKVVQDTINYRKTNNVKRNDFLQLITEIKTNEGKLDNCGGSSLTMEQIAAQSLIFFGAGFETSSSTLTFCLYELAKNLRIQQKLRDEINTVLSKYDATITYDSMLDLKYMTQVLEETLRKYPPVPQVTRKCVKDYLVPNTNVVIEKGTSAFISIYGLHHDPDYYPNPENFDPERFSDENKKGRHQFTYIPFGEGPRICIGMRFGMMQMKVCLTVLLQNYIFSLNQNRPESLTFSPKKFLLESNETIWLDSKPVQKTD